MSADRSLAAWLDDTERRRLERLVRDADRGRFLAGAALLRCAVGAWVTCPPEAVAIDRRCTECGQPHGKPVIQGPGAHRPEVSVAHSGTLIAVAVADGPIGVDVQRTADLEPGRNGTDWVAHEAAYKSGLGEPAILSLDPPLPGYLAALALAADAVPVIEQTTWVPSVG